MLCLFGKRACLRLRRHVDDVTVGVELPAVVETTQAALFVASERERCLAMWTGLAEQAELSAAVAERDELLAEKLNPHRRTVRPGNLFRQQRGHPVTPHQTPHRSVTLDTAEYFVFRSAQHARFSSQAQGHVARHREARKTLSILSLYIFKEAHLVQRTTRGSIFESSRDHRRALTRHFRAIACT